MKVNIWDLDDDRVSSNRLLMSKNNSTEIEYLSLRNPALQMEFTVIPDWIEFNILSLLLTPNGSYLLELENTSFISFSLFLQQNRRRNKRWRLQDLNTCQTKEFQRELLHAMFFSVHLYFQPKGKQIYILLIKSPIAVTVNWHNLLHNVSNPGFTVRVWLILHEVCHFDVCFNPKDSKAFAPRNN